MNQSHNKKRIGDEIRPNKVLLEISGITGKSYNWFKSSMKVFAVILLTAGLSTSLVMVGGTVSYFSDKEVSVGNYMKAEPLSFNVLVSSTTSVVVDMTSGSNSIVPTLASIEGTDVIQYLVKGSFIGGDLDLCNAINTLGTFPFPLDGNLSTFISSTTTTPGSWTLNFSLNDPTAFSSKSCVINLTYEGWNTELPYGSGFKDTRIVSITFNVANIAPVLKTFSLPQSQNIVTPEIVEEPPALPTPSVEAVTGDSGTPPKDTTPQEPTPETQNNQNNNVPPQDPTPTVVTGPTNETQDLSPIETVETLAQ